MFTAALFAIAKTWKQPKCPSTYEWIKKTDEWIILYISVCVCVCVCVYNEYYAVIKRNKVLVYTTMYI